MLIRLKRPIRSQQPQLGTALDTVKEKVGRVRQVY